MKSAFISSPSLMNSPRTTMLKSQVELAKLNQELVSGRFADVTLMLGHRSGQTVTLRQEYEEILGIKDSNGRTLARLEVTDNALTGLLDTANTYLKSLVSLPPQERGPDVIKRDATQNLSALISGLNAFSDGQYVFGGTNTQAQPITDYADGPPASANKAAVEDAFNRFFFGSPLPAPPPPPPTPAQIATITASQMEAFLEDTPPGPFVSLFEPAGWKATWSDAADEGMRSRVSTTDVVETSISANEKAMRKLAQAYTMIRDLGTEHLTKPAFNVLVEKAIGVLGGAVQELISVQAKNGVSLARVKEADAKISVQKDILSKHIGGMESVDPAETKVRIDSLMTQIQMSYSLTGRLQQLSLVNYL